MKNVIAIAAKAKKLESAWAAAVAPDSIFETIEPKQDGSALYVFEAKFKNAADAAKFKALCQLSAELEAMMQNDK